MFLPPQIVVLLFIAGGAAFVLGHRRLALGLLTPAILRWLVFPAAAPVLHALDLWPLLLAAPLLIVFVALKLLQSGVNAIYGRRAGGHVTATYLVRIFDALATAAIWWLALPFRLIIRLISAGRH